MATSSVASTAHQTWENCFLYILSQGEQIRSSMYHMVTSPVTSTTMLTEPGLIAFVMFLPEVNISEPVCVLWQLDMSQVQFVKGGLIDFVVALPAVSR